MLKINVKVVKDVVYNGKRIERIYVGSKKYYDMYDGRINGYAIEAGSLSLAGRTYSYGAGYFDICIGDIGSNNIGTLFSNSKIGTLTHIGIDTRRTNYMGGPNYSFKGMFSGCSSLTSLDVSHFDTSKVTTMYCMFSGCSSLTSLDVSHFDTGNVQYMGLMFFGCSSLTSLDVSHFDTGKVQGMSQMFSGCSSLTSLDVSHFVTGNVNSMDMMFYGCKNMRTLNIGNMDLSGLVDDMSRTFMYCSNLRSITGQFVWLKKSISFGWSTLLDHDSAMMVINSAETVTTVQTIAFSSNTKAPLSDEEKAIATKKGWAVS